MHSTGSFHNGSGNAHLNEMPGDSLLTRPTRSLQMSLTRRSG
jgi:hypothetical protein